MTATSETDRSSPMASNAEELVVVNIVAPSFSGATWANLVLGTHPEAFSIGEMDRIHKMGHAVCTLHGESCDVWSRFDAADSENPFLQLRRLTGHRLFIVNNSKRFLACQRAPSILSKFVFLVRDGRAVVASAVRKSPEKSIWATAGSWARTIRQKQRLLRKEDRRDIMHVVYENLRGNPAAQFEAICDFLGMTFDDQMIDYSRHPHHFLGGNVGTLSMAARAQGIETLFAAKHDRGIAEVKMSQSHYRLDDSGRQRQIDLGYYHRSDPVSFRDERWKAELSDWQLRVFAVRAGRLNRALGYSAGVERGT